MTSVQKIIFVILLAAMAQLEGAAIMGKKSDPQNMELTASDSTGHNSVNQWPNAPSLSSLTLTEALPEQESAKSKRVKRVIIFRPLFVYRQQEIKKQHLKEVREQQQQQQQQHQQKTTQKPANNFKYSNNHNMG